MEREALEADKAKERPQALSTPKAGPSLGPSLDGAIAKAVPASNRLGLDLHRTLAASKPNENLFFSPASVAVALTMTSAGAAGDTLTAMRSTLHLPEAGAHESFGAMIRSWNQPNQAHELSVANRVWLQAGFEVLEPFSTLLTERYGAGIGRADFNDPSANQPINQWVEQQTNSRITDLIPDGVLDGDTRVVLTNAVYFKGTWKIQFDKDKTRPSPFWLLDGSSVDTPMMTLTGAVTSHHEQGVTLIALPYDGDGVEMVALIPSERDGLSPLESALSPELLDQWLTSARPRPVELYFPRLRLETSESLIQPMTELGMGIAMGDSADFSNISGGSPMQIDEILHKAFLELDEEGTEAAAATAVVVGVRSAGGAPEPPTVVRADRPFWMGLRDQQTGAWLFMGRILDPR